MRSFADPETAPNVTWHPWFVRAFTSL